MPMYRPTFGSALPVLISVALVACVPARKYEEEKQRSTAMQQEADAANKKALDV